MAALSIGVLVATPSVCGPEGPSGLGAASPLPRPGRGLDASLDLRSGADIVESLAALGHRPRLIHADDDLDLALRQTELDACLLALHGTIGGSGDIQALLTMRGMPFAGPAASTVSLAFDKVRSRQVLAYHNLPVPASVALGPDAGASGRALGLLGWPCVLKPRHGALGLGVSHIAAAAEVPAALDAALQADHELVLERAIDGEEIQVVLVGDRVLGAMEVHRGHDTGDPQRCEMMCPPQLSRSRLDGAHNLARRAVNALGLDRTITRVDILLSSRHNEVVLEVEPLPPLHREGVVARVARAAGMDHTHLTALVLGMTDMGAVHERGAELSPSVVQ